MKGRKSQKNENLHQQNQFSSSNNSSNSSKEKRRKRRKERTSEDKSTRGSTRTNKPPTEGVQGKAEVRGGTSERRETERKRQRISKEYMDPIFA